MENTTPVEIKIYRDGAYSLKDNLKAKAKLLMEREGRRIDMIFIDHRFTF
jgi:hypothetical protein